MNEREFFTLVKKFVKANGGFAEEHIDRDGTTLKVYAGYSTNVPAPSRNKLITVKDFNEHWIKEIKKVLDKS